MSKIKICYLILLSVLLPVFKFIVLILVQKNATTTIPFPDFATLWAGTRLALLAEPNIYSPLSFIPKASHLIPHFSALPLIVPPTYLAMLTPLAGIRFDVAMLLWNILTIAFLGIAINSIIKDRIIWLFAIFLCYLKF